MPLPALRLTTFPEYDVVVNRIGPATKIRINKIIDGDAHPASLVPTRRRARRLRKALSLVDEIIPDDVPVRARAQHTDARKRPPKEPLLVGVGPTSGLVVASLGGNTQWHHKGRSPQVEGSTE